MAGIDRDHVIAALHQIFEREIARPHIDRRRADHRNHLHAVEDRADIVVRIRVVVHVDCIFRSQGTSFRGDAIASNPESRDSGSGPSDHPGMTESKWPPHNYLSRHFGSRLSMKAQMPSSASRAIMFSVITSA